jgi:hypothetical protein
LLFRHRRRLAVWQASDCRWLRVFLCAQPAPAVALGGDHDQATAYEPIHDQVAMPAPGSGKKSGPAEPKASSAPDGEGWQKTQASADLPAVPEDVPSDPVFTDGADRQETLTSVLGSALFVAGIYARRQYTRRPVGSSPQVKREPGSVDR